MTGESSTIPATLPFTSIILCLGMFHKKPHLISLSPSYGISPVIRAVKVRLKMSHIYETDCDYECVLAVYTLRRFLAAVSFRVHK
jgi:hypothetical protein